MTDVVKIVRAFQPGDVVFIETDRDLTTEQMASIRTNLDKYLGDTGVKAVVLCGGMKLAARQEVITDGAAGD